MMAGTDVSSRGRASSPHDDPPLLEVIGACKRFGAVVALEGVDLRVCRGETVALVGDNGAGKSTLIKAISGVHRLDEGEIRIDGEPVVIDQPSVARRLGIETVYQDLALFDNLGVEANFYAGREITRWPRTPFMRPFRSLGLVQRKAMRSEAQELLDRLRVHVPDLKAPVGLMSGGQRQAIAVSRAVAFATRIVILDEPTAALGMRETRSVIDLVGRLPDQGVAVILISHNLTEISALADRAVVLRRGRRVGELVPSAGNHEQLVSLIVGAEGSWS